jgi:hypothetical protein
MVIRDEDGQRVEGVLLAASRERIRVAIDSEYDTAEFHWVATGWYTEKGAEIEIEALIPITATDFSDFCTAVYPWTMAAGSGFAFD